MRNKDNIKVIAGAPSGIWTMEMGITFEWLIEQEHENALDDEMREQLEEYKRINPQLYFKLLQKTQKAGE